MSLFNGLSDVFLLVELVLFCELVIEVYFVNECPVKFIIMLPSIHHHLVYTHSLVIMHAIVAPETAVSFELERVNPEGPEVNQETEVLQQDKRSPKRKSSALVTSPLCS